MSYGNRLRKFHSLGELSRKPTPKCQTHTPPTSQRLIGDPAPRTLPSSMLFATAHQISNNLKTQLAHFYSQFCQSILSPRPSMDSFGCALLCAQFNLAHITISYPIFAIILALRLSTNTVGVNSRDWSFSFECYRA